jgi:hypothetical protein
MSAIFSPCGTYRYRLERELGQTGPTGAFIMVNPSTADAICDDHTITKVQGFARRLGWSRVIVGNVFAYRATNIGDLASAPDATGPDNAAHLARIMDEAGMVICGWGRLSKLPPGLRGEWRGIAGLAQRTGMPLHCFGTTRDGHPLHPLTLPYALEPRRWSVPC